MKSIQGRQQKARQILELACHEFEKGKKEEAAKLFERSAALGSNEAKVNIGNLLTEGIGVERNLPLAKKMYRSAYKGGCAYGATALGVQYMNEGKNFLAVLWFKKAALLGEDWAKEYLLEYRNRKKVI